VISNSKPANGIRLIAPGMFARVRLPIGKPHPALLVIDRAIGSDQGLKFVYVVDNENKVQQRRIETGSLQEDGLRVVTSGLKPDESIVVGGIQQVRPRMTIVPDRQPMPSLSGPATSTAQTTAKTGTPAVPAKDNTQGKAERSKAASAPEKNPQGEPMKTEPPGSTGR
jgi:multidrug efflux system membrane fusion protein